MLVSSALRAAPRSRAYGLQWRSANSSASKRSVHSQPKWWIWGSSDHGQFGNGEQFSWQPSPIEMTCINKFGLESVNVGMNSCAAKSRTSDELYAWGENPNKTILTQEDENVTSPKLLGHGTAVFAGWNSIWTVDNDNRRLHKYGPSYGLHLEPEVDFVGIDNIVTSAFQTVFLRKNGSVSFYNDRKDVEFQDVELPNHFVQVAAGWSHFLLLHADGSLWTVGANKHGQCGVGHTNHVISPVKMETLGNTKIKAIAAGATHSLALTESGSLLCWGSYKDGKLGIETDKDIVEPTEIAFFGGKGIERIAAGCDHSAVVTANGDIYAWGFGQHGALGTGELLDAPFPVKIPRFQGDAKIVDIQCGMDVTLVKTL